MFNKPGVFTRNDPVTRRDNRPILGSGTQTGTGSATTTSAPATDNATTSPAPAQSAAPAQSPASATPDAPRELPANSDNIMGARLIVGPDVKLKGAEILDCDTLVVEGRVEATMDSRVIRIADKGSFVGKVSIDIAEIHGNFEGELTARSQLIIHATGRVSGKIRYGKLVIDEGGEISGEIRSLSHEEPTPLKPRIEPVVTLNAVAG